MDIPKNMASVSATVEFNDITYSTNIAVQTHKISELKYAAELAWEATLENLRRGTVVVPVVNNQVVLGLNREDHSHPQGDGEDQVDGQTPTQEG